MYLPSDPRLEWPGEGALFELNLNKCWGQMWALFESPLGHYLCQACKTGSVFESLLRPLLKSGLWPLFWPDLSSLELEVGDLNRCIFHLTQDWNGLGRGHYSS